MLTSRVAKDYRFLTSANWVKAKKKITVFHIFKLITNIVDDSRSNQSDSHTLMFENKKRDSGNVNW